MEGVLEDALEKDLGSCSLIREGGENLPFGRWVGEERCMVGDTWAIFGLCEDSAARKKSPSKPILYAEKWYDSTQSWQRM